MTASDHLNPQQFYHFSPQPFEPGDTVEPGHQQQRYSGGYRGKPGYVYAASNPVLANKFAQEKGHTAKSIYTVEPTGDVEPDEHNLPLSYRSKAPFKVTGRLDWSTVTQEHKDEYKAAYH